MKSSITAEDEGRIIFEAVGGRDLLGNDVVAFSVDERPGGGPCAPTHPFACERRVDNEFEGNCDYAESEKWVMHWIWGSRGVMWACSGVASG